MSNIFFYLPFAFTFHTRYKGSKGFYAFILKYFLLTLLGVIWIVSFDFIRYIIGLILMYSLYEFGYIYNDTETIKKENHPTLRLSQDELLFYERKKISIYLIRVTITMLIAFLAIMYDCSYGILSYSFLILPVFFIYNKVRNKWNLHIHIMLMYLRFSVPMFIAINDIPYFLAVWILFMYPIRVFIELSVKGKFGYQNKIFMKYLLSDYSLIHPFRVKYYILISLICLLITLFSTISLWYMLPTAYYLIFTLLSAKYNRRKLQV